MFKIAFRNQWDTSECCLDLFSFILHKNPIVGEHMGIEITILGFGMFIAF